MLESHFVLMVVFAAVVSVMSAFLKFNTARDVRRYAAKMFAVMVSGGIVLSWLMAFV